MEPADLKAFKAAILHAHGCRSRYAETVPVREVCHGRVTWEGKVHVFDLDDHPIAQQCYAWSDEEHGQTVFLSVLASPPFSALKLAVREVLAAKARGDRQRAKTSN